MKNTNFQTNRHSNANIEVQYAWKADKIGKLELTVDWVIIIKWI